MADPQQDSEDEVREGSVDSSKSRVVYGTFRCMSGSHDAKGNFKVRYDSGEQVYEKRVPKGDPRSTAAWLREELGLDDE